MEVLVGSTFSIEVSSPPTQRRVPPPSRLFLEGGAADEDYPSPDEEEVSSESSSSIGSPGDSEEEKEEEEEDGVVSSKPRLGLGLGLGSLDSMEESLPVKRGLSNHYSGKSKSFANLSDVSNMVSTIKEVEKPDNPFNKRRRLLLANKLQRKSFYNWRNPKSMPVLNTLIEEDQEEENQDDHHEENQEHRQENEGSNSMLPPKGPRVMDVRFKASFKSYSCFSLTDLQEEHDEDDDQ